MKLKRLLNRKRLVVLICVLLLVLAGYLIFNSYIMYEMTSHSYRAEMVDAMGQRMNLLFLEINDFPRDAGDDILYFGRSEYLRHFINSVGAVREDFKKELERDLVLFLDVNEVYYQSRYIDENGDEIIKAEFDGEKYSIVEEENLQNKKDRYYFKEASMLGPGEIYVSYLDLNMKHGAFENIGTIENPKYISIIRYAMPVFDDFGVNRGIVVLNVYADYFLEDIRRLAKENDISFLIDKNGYYLAHPNKSKEFSFMFDDDEDSILKDYPDASRVILGGFDERIFENEDYIFTFRYIYPTIGTFEMYEGSKKVFGEDSEKEYYWVLVSVSDKSEVNQSVKAVRYRFIVFVLFSILMVALMFVLLLIILAINGSLKR
ncbi:cache domain-containing protein [Candidatus Pacearchaeota archaeon]|nr:cache domain-containing protein [Candidatus Pacearchaeota archaeon]